MENQHRKITGYRELTVEEIELMNEIKAQGENLRALLKKLQLRGDLDQRAVSIARTKLQEGIMWAVRSVAQPESF
jgi:hypothetical protein